MYLFGALLIFGLMTVLWLISLSLRDASIVDIFWGFGFVCATWFYFTGTPEGFLGRKWLLSSLATLWGLRLALHIFFRNLGKGEDFRYRKWRDEAGQKWWWQSYFKVFMLQGLILWLVSAPLLAGQTNPAPSRLTWLDYAGLVAWGIGFYFEAMGDWQLARFKANPANRGRLLTGGVWRFTRHPNYFGDAAQWWGFFLIAAAAGGWWSVYSPILMTFLLVRISGVAMLERSLAESKPGYKEYVESTSAFIPWFPANKT
jgi:steroid 5-alpha reductase family enzyme